MALINGYFDKETFLPDKNYFQVERVKVTRQETSEEIRLTNLASKYNTASIWVILSSLLLLMLGSPIFYALKFYVVFWCVITSSIAGILIFLLWLMPQASKYHDLLVDYINQYREELWEEPTIDLVSYNNEQHKIAEAWRAEHPLEEKIRACIKDPSSSVDIANLARYYAEVYIREKENEQ